MLFVKEIFPCNCKDTMTERLIYYRNLVWKNSKLNTMNFELQEGNPDFKRPNPQLKAQGFFLNPNSDYWPLLFLTVDQTGQAKDHYRRNRSGLSWFHFYVLHNGSVVPLIFRCCQPILLLHLF